MSSKAFLLVERLGRLLCENGLSGAYAIYAFRGFPAGGGAFGGSGSTASTKNVEDHLRAKNLVAGHDYEWVTPLTLKILQNQIDRDLLDSIQVAGGVEQALDPGTEEAEEGDGGGAGGGYE